MKISEELVKTLYKNKMTISTAESCTGGLIAKLITDIPGSSDVFGYGFVTYANEAKTKLIGVCEALLSQYGAVSKPVAVLMSRGARRVSGSDIALSVTGIAGPGGGTSEKPVGLVYISLSTPDGTICRKCNFGGTREEVRQQTAEFALNLALGYAKKHTISTQI